MKSVALTTLQLLAFNTQLVWLASPLHTDTQTHTVGDFTFWLNFRWANSPSESSV